MASFEAGAYDAIKAWHGEWSRVPMYVATVSFGAIAFSITNLWQKNAAISSEGLALMKVSWVCLAISAGLASAGIFLGYVAFDLGTRVHLESTLRDLSIRVPKQNTRWISYFGRGSWACTLIAIVLLLIGSVFLILFTIENVVAT